MVEKIEEIILQLISRVTEDQFRDQCSDLQWEFTFN